MPPKQKDAKTKKMIEDKTFGLKNKSKSKKVQQFVSSVESQVKFAGKSLKQVKDEEKARADKKAAQLAQKEAEKMNAQLFAPAVRTPTLAVGQDPKSVLCPFFKAGTCNRGNKCKYSHDLMTERSKAKIDLYHDPRAEGQDNIDKWDTKTLEEVVKTKEKGRLPPTNIICKYFLDAIENSTYGWRWECENGKECHYRHALPPGYVLKTKADKERERELMMDGEEGLKIEEIIEEERKKLDLAKCTPVTLDSFTKWKVDRAAKKVEEAKEKAKLVKSGGGHGNGSNTQMSGRDLFRFDPNLFVDDEEADDEKYEIESEGEEDEDEEHGVARGVGDNEDDDKEGDDAYEVNEQHVVDEEKSAAINENLYLDEEDVEGEEGEEEEEEEGEEEEDGDEDDHKGKK